MIQLKKSSLFYQTHVYKKLVFAIFYL